MNTEELKEKYPEIAKMTVAQVVVSDEFESIFNNAIDTIKDARKKLLASVKNLKRNIYDRLEERGLFNIDDFRAQYCMCIDKESDLPAELRKFVLAFGNNIYNDTIKKMMELWDKSH